MRAEEKATFEAALLDVTKSVTQLEKAVETLKASALLQGKSSTKALAHVQGLMKTAVNMADAMGLVEDNSGSARSLDGTLLTARWQGTNEVISAHGSNGPGMSFDLVHNSD